MLICISGSSGVGKTTISRLISLVLGDKACTLLSGDDLHRWERMSEMWNIHTHLNPSANDLQNGLTHIRALLSGQTIERRRYNHDSGKFDDPIVVTPTEHVIYEGLHALYDPAVIDLSDVCIFVDTDQDLKTEWKIRRDTKKRGYTQSQVVETMIRRKKDEELYISPQKDNADVVVKFTKNRDGGISLEYVSVTSRGEKLMESVKEFYDSMMEFLNLCKWTSMDPSLVQGKGGNISVKSDTGLIIKSSGCRIVDVNMNHGFCLCGLKSPLPAFSVEEEYEDYMLNSIRGGFGRPSMEAGFHATMTDRVVVHTHPIHLNAILCSEEAPSILSVLFSDMPYEFIPYHRPGMKLSNRISSENHIVFLENHGLIVGADTAQQAFETTERINNRCKRWLSNHVESFIDMDDDHAVSKPLFPDAAVLPVEMNATNNYILGLINSACLTPKFLSDGEVLGLNDMTSEKHRKSTS
jgi:uridine kinase/ribulose-5-phosphate 4-epimerase/fuculose-1-phosphate aldolase